LAAKGPIKVFKKDKKFTLRYTLNNEQKEWAGDKDKVNSKTTFKEFKDHLGKLADDKMYYITFNDADKTNA
jgi:hypothetical protein